MVLFEHSPLAVPKEVEWDRDHKIRFESTLQFHSYVSSSHALIFANQLLTLFPSDELSPSQDAAQIVCQLYHNVATLHYLHL